MSERAIPAPKGAETWTNIPHRTNDQITDPILAPYEDALTRETGLNGAVAVAEPIQVTDTLPRRADGTAKMGPQGWDGKWNRPAGYSRVDTTPISINNESNTTDKVGQVQVTEPTSVTPETNIGNIEQQAESAKETLVYQAPNRLPGSTRRVQPW